MCPCLDLTCCEAYGLGLIYVPLFLPAQAPRGGAQQGAGRRPRASNVRFATPPHGVSIRIYVAERGVID